MSREAALVWKPDERAIRILRMVQDTGPRKRTVLLGIGDDALLDRMRHWGLLKVVGSKRGTTYGYGSLAKLCAQERDLLHFALRKPPAKARRG